MIGYTVIKFSYIIKDYGEVEEFLPKCQLLENTYGYIGSALVDSSGNHICVILSGKEWVSCFVPYNLPCDLFRTYSS